MARKPTLKPARPVYHEVQPGGTSRGNTLRAKVVRGEAQGLGRRAWLIIALIALLLVDMFVWHGFYAHKLWAAINVGGAAGRRWSDNLWN